MLKKWIKLLNLPGEPYFGSLYDKDSLNNFFYVDAHIKKNIDYASYYFSHTANYFNIIISGTKGSGKTSFVNYMQYLTKLSNGQTPFEIIKIDLEHVKANNVEKLFPMLEKNVVEHMKNSGLDTNIIDKIINKADDIHDSVEKIIYLLSERDDFLSTKEERDKFIFKNLVVIIDQVDFLDYKMLIDILEKIFFPFNPGQKFHVIKCVCVRRETAEAARKYGADYFSTHFSRHIELEAPPLRDVLNKRFYLTDGKTKIKDIHSILSIEIDNFITQINNNNLRRMLEQVCCIFENISPYDDPKEVNLQLASEKIKENFFDLLLSKNYIQNLYQRISPTHKYPIMRTILEALTVYPIIDKKFKKVIENEFGFSEIEYKHVLEELARLDITKPIYHSTDQSYDFYEFTPAGDLYSTLIFDQSYAKKCEAQRLWGAIHLWARKYGNTEDFIKLAGRYSV